MQRFWFISALNFSIMLPAIAATKRYRFISNDFKLFIFLIWLGLINETLSLTLILIIRTNAVNSNIYVLIEFLLLVCQFYNWQTFTQATMSYLIIFGSFVWVLDNFILHKISDNNSIFRAAYSLLIMFMSLLQIKKITIKEIPTARHAGLLICITFFCFYSFKAFIEVFNVFNIGLSITFFRNLWMILYLLNFFSNISYLIAILWMPSNKNYLK